MPDPIDLLSELGRKYESGGSKLQSYYRRILSHIRIHLQIFSFTRDKSEVNNTMFIFKQKSADGSEIFLSVPGITLNCNTPPEETMKDFEDYEPIIPTDDLVQGGPLIYITHAPFEFVIAEGIRISCPYKGAGTKTIGVYAGNVGVEQNIFIAPVVLDTDTVLVPWTNIKPQFRTIGAGVRLACRVDAETGVNPYQSWYGLRVAFIFKSAEE